MSPAPARRIITPEHFKVAPEILGLPLAAPSRRAVAMAIDLVIIALLVKTGGVLLGIAAAVVLFRASAPDQRSGLVRSSVRTGLRLAGAVVLFVVIVNGWGFWRDRGEADEEAEVPDDVAVAEDLDIRIAPRELPKLAGSFITLRSAADSANVAEAARTVLNAAQRSGASTADLHEARGDLLELMSDTADASLRGAIDAAILDVAGPPPSFTSPEPITRAYLSAIDRDDAAAIRAYHDSLKTAVAGEQLNQLDLRIRTLDQRGDSLEEALEASQAARGLRTFLAGAADDFGVGFGWSAVYFTAFLALWRGQTPGKRAARIRVLRLDGKPLGWWISFERFGGYAASFSVGLMGFFQILWDRNRQGLHDKACETVVVNDFVRTR